LGLATKRGERQRLGGHADEFETAMILTIAPGSVRLDRAVPDYGHMLDGPETVFSRPVRYSSDPASGLDFSATGVRGDPTLADVQVGERLLSEMTRELVEGIGALYPDVIPPLRE
jgi:creatinine amidohydrolase